MSSMRLFSALLTLLLTTQAYAISDDFTQATDTNNWVALGYACLTAGTTSNNSTTAATTSSTYSSIPGCNYGTPDTPGGGALRLTPSSGNMHGSIVSNYTMPTNQGLQITFTTYTFDGQGNGGGSNQGADGMSFFLQDGAVGTTVNGLSNIGQYGGSLGYSCAQGKGDGLNGAYLGLGIDEWGNFLNAGDNTATGILNTNYTGGTYGTPSAINGSNSYKTNVNNAPTGSGGAYYQPNRIGLRGAGNVSGYWLNQNYPNLYPSAAANSSAVEATCGTGLLQNNGNGTYSVGFSGLAWAGGVLTVTTNSPFYGKVGDTVNIGTSSTSHPPTSNGVSIVGSYVVTSVPSSSSFTIALPGGSSTFSHISNGTVTVSVLDYAVIPGGYWVLPSNQKISSTDLTVTRPTATPITYKLIITPSGYLTFMYNYNNTGFQTVLPNPNTPGTLFNVLTANGGSLPGSFRFGFAGSTGGAMNNHDITCFAAQPLASNSSVGANTVQAGQLQTNTQIYLASYNTNSWSGSVTASGVTQGTSGLVIAQNTTWDADCVLTGGGCMSMGSTNGVANNTITVEAPSSRQLLTWNGTSGAALESGTITSAQQTVLNSTDSYGAIRLDWLRGGRGNELTATPTPGPLRTRAGVLGDIVDSSPTFVGAPTTYTYATFTDSLYGGAPPEAAHP